MVALDNCSVTNPVPPQNPVDGAIVGVSVLNVSGNDSTDSEFLGIEPRNDGKSLVGVFTARRGDSVT